MSLFGQLIRTAVNAATLPVAVVKDVIMSAADAGAMGNAGEGIGHRTAAHVEKLKREAEDDNR